MSKRSTNPPKSRAEGHGTSFPGKESARAGAFFDSLLAEVAAAVLATENCSWLADEAIASGVPIIVTAVVAVVVVAVVGGI
jgi:hypothetical protein